MEPEEACDPIGTTWVKGSGPGEKEGDEGEELDTSGGDRDLLLEVFALVEAIETEAVGNGEGGQADEVDCVVGDDEVGHGGDWLMMDV